MLMTQLLVLISLAIQPGAAAKADWATVTSASPPFTLSMPAEPKTLSQTVDSPQGAIDQTVYFAKVGGVLFTAQVLRLPEAAMRGTPEAILERQCQDVVKSSAGKLVRQAKSKVETFPAWDAVTRGPAPQGAKGTVTSRHRYVLAGRDLVALTVMSRVDADLPADAERFIASFRPTGGKPPAAIKDGTPEDALRTFLLAVMLHDEPTLRAVTLPAEGFEWLMRGQEVPPEQRDAFRAQFASKQVAIRRLKAGDTFTLPGKRVITIPAQDVTADRAVLVMEGAPIPTRMRKTDGHWRVDATPVIAARKAADAARRKAERKDR